MSVTTAYIPHLVYSLAVTSLATHLLWKRTSANEERLQMGAQITLLESLSRRIRAGDVSDVEVERLRRLARTERSEPTPAATVNEEIRWRDVILGKARTSSGKAKSEEYDRRDWEKGELCSLSSVSPIQY